MLQAVVVFGDPFEGAKIKGYDGPILTYCNAGDSVCTGNFVISASHLSYTGSVAQQAVAAMKKIAAKTAKARGEVHEAATAREFSITEV
jgi:hypothetical protein